MISVIIPSYNEEKHLQNVLDHLLKGKNIEIIISDGGSRDNTIEIAKEYFQQHKNMKLITGSFVFHI